MLVVKYRNVVKFAGSLIVLSIISNVGIAQEAQPGKAQIIFEARSQSTATRGKNYKITYYMDEQCSRRGKTDKVAQKKFADDIHVFNPYMVETDTNFIFQIAYLEKRRAETRRCTSMVNVPLQAGRKYKAIYQVIDQVIGCNIKVFDVTDVIEFDSEEASDTPDQSEAVEEASEVAGPLEVPFTKPEFSCTKVGKQGYKNGAPVYSYKDRLG